MKSRYRFNVEWGDTDAAGIVFYPNFFKWFDAGTWRLLIGAGLTEAVLRDRHGLLGCPIVAANAEFLRPARFWDELELTSYISEVSGKSFLVSHEIRSDGELRAQGEEKRVAVRLAEPGGKRIEAVALPEAIRSLLWNGDT